MKTLALQAFKTPPENLNCAQSVLRAYQLASGDLTLSVDDLKSMGGGRAPDGVCGALHAACCILPSAADALRSEFASRSGSIRCRELKGKSQQACPACVSTAAELLAAALARGPVSPQPSPL